MRKFKKLLSFVTAAAITAGMLTGFSSVASADGESETAASVAYENGKITVAYKANEKANVIVASYNNKKLTSMSAKEVTFDANGKAEVEKTLNAGDTVFLWDGLGSMIPILKEKYVQPSPTPKPTINPADIYYKLDFENTDNPYIYMEDNAKVDKTLPNTTTTELWASQYYSAGMSMETDSSKSDINRYYLYNNNMTARKGQRTSYMILPEAAGTVDTNKQAVVEFDFKFHNGTGANQLVLIGSMDTPIGNNMYAPSENPKGNAPILKLNQEGANITINDSTTAKVTNFVPDAWAHAKAVMNFETKSVIVTLTSLDGSKTFFETAQVPMGEGNGATKLSQLFVGAPSTGAGAVSMDNIMVRKVLAGDITDTYYNVTFDVDGKETVVSGKEGDTITSVPDTAKTGYIFDGWHKDSDTTTVLSTETVLNTPLSANVKYTAVYHKDSDYIEPLVKLEFAEFPENGYPTEGADRDTPADNLIKVKLIGEIGTDLLENLDARVTDLDIDWEFDGFRHIASKAANNEDPASSDALTSNTYCDSYAEVVYDNEDPASVNFKLKKQAFNFYGQVKATVTYNGKIMTITKPMAILPSKAATAGVYLPKPGYYSDMNVYSDDMVGYQATISADNKSATDIVTGDWAAYGGNSGRGLSIVKDEETNKKYLKLKSTGNNSSSFAVNKLSEAPTGQVIVSQDVCFHNANSSILFKQENPVTWNDNATSFSLNFTGNALNMNNSEICAATTGVWYHIVLSADVTSKLCYAKVYDMEGNLLGSSDIMPFVNAGSIAPVYLCYRTPDNSQGELDFNNVKMYTPEIAGNLTTTIDNDVLSIPEEGVTTTITSANLTVSGVSTEDYDIIGNATWSVEGDPQGITVTPDETDSHKAVLTIGAAASANDYNVVVSMGGKTTTIPFKVSASGDNISFTQATRSISIPLTSGSATATYKAQIQDKTNTKLADGDNVTYAVYDKNNTTDITESLPTGITFAVDNATHTATLSVSEAAKATVLYIRATGNNTDGDSISNAVRVDVHGLAFDFGTDAANAVAEGYTAVTPTTSYTASNGYGLAKGTPTAGGVASTEDPDGDNLTGTFTFQAKVEPKKVYNVTVNYNGAIASEYVSEDLSGVNLTNAEKGAVTYVIPVIDDILDLAFTSSTVSSIVIEKQADKLPNAKPHVFTVGDSTIANNGSWAYVMARDFATYTNLPDIVTFTNNGRGGKNLCNYYTGGELRDRVLSQVKPGDYVMIGDMGTNGLGATFEADFNYYIDACEAMGAKVILNSYSPHGAVGNYASGYNSTTHTFDSYRRDSGDPTVRAIYAERSDSTNEKYDEKVIGFVDIGRMADAAFNAYVADYAANGYADENAAAQAIITCFGDHNHYSNGALAAQLMILGYGDSDDAKGIVKALYEIISADLSE